MAGISPALPMRRDSIDGFALNKTMVEAIQQNLKNLILTAPGERMMIPEFGVGIKNYLFEMNDDSIHSEIRANINGQVQKYMPFISILDIIFAISEFEDNSVNIQISYEIVPIEASDVLFIQV